MKINKIWMAIGITFASIVLIFISGIYKGFVTSIEVNQNSIDPYYLIGDVDFEEMELVLIYSNNFKDKVTMDESMISASDLASLTSIGEHTVTVNYKEFSTSLTITLVNDFGPFTVSFYNHLDSFISVSFVEIGQSAIAPKYEAPAGYILSGWDKDFSKVISNVNVHAEIQPIEYDIVYELAEGLNGPNNPSKYTIESETFHLTPATKQGYTFMGWYDVSNQLVNSVEKGHVGDLFLRAIFEPTIYSISYETNGGTEVESDSYAYLSHINPPNNPIREGHTFVAWYQDESLTTPYTFDTMPASGITLYAKWEVNNYLLIFDSLGGSEVSSISHLFGEPIGVLPSPTLLGYTFDGWFLDSNGEYPFVNSTMGSTDLTIYARWLINAYSISFDSLGGTSVPSLTADYLSAIHPPLEPTREGYTFGGWYTDEEYRQVYSFVSMQAHDITLYAKWMINPYTLTFNSVGGSNVSSITEDYLTPLISPEDPTKEGYTFAGWYKDMAYLNPYVFTFMDAQNTMIYAKWDINTYTLSFDSLGGSLVSSQMYTFDSSIILPTSPNRQGYTFDKWTIDELGTLPFNLTEMPSKSLTLYAKWVINSYTLSFDTDGGEPLSSRSIIYGNPIELPTEVKKEGYTFVGWYLDEGLSSPVQFENMPAYSFIVVAKWSINSYSITFNSNGGSSVDEMTLEYLSTLQLPLTTRVGYTFDGWYSDTELTIPFKVTIMPSYDIELMAKWTINQYILSFNSLGGSAVTSITADYLSKITAPIAPTKTGYTFVGWYLESTLTTPFTWDTMGPQNRTLYAKWSINGYTISFDSMGGTLVDPMTENYGATLKAPPSPTRQGYSFSGWYFSSTYQTPYTWSTMAANNITIYAKWIPNFYTISFVSQGGTTQDPISIAYLDPITAPNNPTRLGYSFSEWTIDKEGLIPFEWTTMPYENVTLYGQWTIQSFTINYVLNGGDGQNEQMYDYQSTIDFLEPTKEGYNFAGWYLDSALTTEPAIIEMPAEDITLYAKWLINSYTITLYLNGGSGKASIVEEFDEVISSPLVTKIGYTLAGWYLENTFETKYTFTTMPAENFSLYAKWIINSYTFTFVVNGGTSITPITQNYQSSIVAPLEPTKVGYTFNGWYQENTFTSLYTFTTMPAKDTTLYAKWTINSYTITYNTLGGESVETDTFDYGSPLVDLPTPSKLGYVFSGWYLDESGDTINPYVTMPNSSFTLYAQYEIDQFTIDFDTKGGSSIESITLDYLSQITAPIEPEKQGYTFGGWFSDETFLEPYVFSTMPADNITLFSKWTINSYLISYESNGGSFIEDSSFNYDELISLPSAPTRLGYTFSGWYNSFELIDAFSLMTMPDYSFTLYAKWSINSYTLSFDAQGGSYVESITADYLSMLTEPTAPTRIGYSLLGWYLDKNGTQLYSFTTMPAQHLTIYAKWSINSYSLTFNSLGGSNVTTITQVFNTVVSEPMPPTKTGYTFLGWTSDEQGTQTYSFSKMPGQSMTLYAQWSINSYQVTYVVNGGSEITAQTINYGTAIQMPIDPTRTGFSFGGWYLNKELTTSMTLTSMPDYSFSLYAKWNINSYTISFNSNGGSLVSSITSYYGSAIVSPSAPSKTGYTFSGWYDDANFSNLYIFSTMGSFDFTLYAKWSVNSYTITYETNGGSSLPSAINPYLSVINAPNPPTRTGYSFSGWFKDANLTQSYSFTTMPAQHLTLYAKWSLNSYTITYQSNGGTSVTSVTQVYNSALSAPTAPTREGYAFAGWYSDTSLTQLYSFSTMPAQSLTLYAKWTAITYTLTFNANGGTSVTAITSTYNTTISAPSAPLKAGYRFSGWYSDALLTSPYVFSTMPAGSFTLYAKWIHIASENVLKELDEAMAASDEIIMPYYATSMPVWSTKWSELETAVSLATTQYNSKLVMVESGATLTSTQQSELHTLSLQIQKIVYQYRNYLDVEDSLGYRTIASGKGFEWTINDQSLNDGGDNRMRLYFDQDSKTVYFLMSENLQNQSVIAGIFALGLKGGMFNFLSSENLYQFKSGNETLNLYLPDGTKKSDTTIQNEAQNLALEWIDMTQWDIIVKGVKFSTFNYLTIQSTFVLMMDDNESVHLRTKFETTYTFKFLPASVAAFDPTRYYYVGPNETIGSYSFNEAKTAYINEINAYYNALNQATYSIEEWTTITTIKNNGIQQLNNLAPGAVISWRDIILLKQSIIQNLYNLAT